MMKQLAKIAALTDQLADIVLSDGLSALALRAAAARLGTSDRMLLYYFGSKSALVIAVLTRISERLAVRMAEAAPSGRLLPAPFLTWAWTLFADAEIEPSLKIWAEIASLGARGEEPYRQFAAATVASWLEWIEQRLDMKPGAARTKTAASLLAIIEGMRALELSRPGTTAGVVDLLSVALHAGCHDDSGKRQ